MNHKKIIQLTIAYTLVIAFVFTALATAFSMVGWLKFADNSQQQKLFYLLIAEVTAVSVGYFKEFIKFRQESSTHPNPFGEANPPESIVKEKLDIEASGDSGIANTGNTINYLDK